VTYSQFRDIEAHKLNIEISRDINSISHRRNQDNNHLPYLPLWENHYIEPSPLAFNKTFIFKLHLDHKIRIHIVNHIFGKILSRYCHPNVSSQYLIWQFFWPLYNFLLSKLAFQCLMFDLSRFTNIAHCLINKIKHSHLNYNLTINRGREGQLFYEQRGT
jgi:hypothetical protein